VQKGYCCVLGGTEVVELEQFHSVSPVGGATLNGVVGKEIDGGVDVTFRSSADASSRTPRYAPATRMTKATTPNVIDRPCALMRSHSTDTSLILKRGTAVTALPLLESEDRALGFRSPVPRRIVTAWRFGDSGPESAG
jgi:hypothetical protein